MAVADPTLTRVVQSWQPRFLANGIDPNDYQRTVSGLATWEEWYAAWMRLGGEHEQLAEDASRAGRAMTAGEAYYRAALAYHFAVFSWVHNLDEYDAGHRKRVDCYRAADAASAGSPPAALGTPAPTLPPDFFPAWPAR